MAAITDLTELSATPANDDLLVVHDASSGSPQDKKITVGNLLGGVPKSNGTATFSTLTATTANLTTVNGSTVNASTGFRWSASGQTITHIYRESISTSFPSLGSTVTGTINLTFTNALVGDIVLMRHNAPLPEELIIQAYVSSSNNVRVMAHNPTGGTISPSTQTIVYTLIRFA